MNGISKFVKAVVGPISEGHVLGFANSHILNRSSVRIFGNPKTKVLGFAWS
jgi:hypothetical protein